MQPLFSSCGQFDTRHPVGAEGHELVAYNLRSPHQVLGRMNLGSTPKMEVPDLVANGNTLIGLSSPFNLVIIETANNIS